MVDGFPLQEQKNDSDRSVSLAASDARVSGA
jgi:hypothetical protein